MKKYECVRLVNAGLWIVLAVAVVWPVFPLRIAPAQAQTAAPAHNADSAAQVFMQQAASLEKDGNYKLAAQAYEAAAKAFEKANEPAEQATALEKSADMYEKLANQLAGKGNTAKGTTTAPKPAPQPGTQPPPVKHPTTAAPHPAPPTNAVPFPAVKFPPLAARPGWIIGRAVFENGQPIPHFHVTTAGFNGKFSPFLNNNLGGPQVRQTGTTFAEGDGANGFYQIQVKEDATMTDVRATTVMHYKNSIFTLDLWPTDNLADGTSPGYFRGHTKQGIVRNFVLKLEGLRPDHTAAEYPDFAVAATTSGRFAYYGGTLYVDCSYSSVLETRNDEQLFKLFPKATVTLTLTPTGPRVDGLPARTIKRSSPTGSTFNLYGIPFAPYTVTAQVTEPNGTVHDIRVSAKIPGASTDWLPSAPVEWRGPELDLNAEARDGTYLYLAK